MLIPNDDWNEPRFDAAAVTIRTDTVIVPIHLVIYQAPCQVPSTHIYFALYNNLLSRLSIPILKMRKLRLAEVKLRDPFTQVGVKGRHPKPRHMTEFPSLALADHIILHASEMCTKGVPVVTVILY